MEQNPKEFKDALRQSLENKIEDYESLQHASSLLHTASKERGMTLGNTERVVRCAKFLIDAWLNENTAQGAG